MKEFKPTKIKGWLIPKLRRLSYQWPERNRAKQLARVERGKYKCNICKKIFGPSDIVMDHINPVVSIEEGFINLGTYVESLFCSVENFQACCKQCHGIKTLKENELRNK